MSAPLWLSRVLSPARFDALLLDLYGPGLMPAQRPVLVSQWSKYYFALVWRLVASGGQVPLFTQTRIVLDARGLPLELSADAGYCGDLEQLLEHHLTPLVQRLATLGEVAAAVLWGNAGDCLDQALQHDQVDSTGLRRLLETPGSPLYAAVTRDAACRRRRRTCCLSYKVDWVGHCEHCPLLA